MMLFMIYNLESKCIVHNSEFAGLLNLPHDPSSLCRTGDIWIVTIGAVRHDETIGSDEV